jgi:nicotinamide-nucleotide amidase
MNIREIEYFATEVGARLQKQGWYLVTAESCTGGWLAEAITAIPGSSKWFDRGFVAYSNPAKQDMLKVSPETLTKYGAVSEQTAIEMVKGALAHSQAHVGIAITGLAGPSGGTSQKPVGTVWIAYASPNSIYAQRSFFPGDRHSIRYQAVITALQRLSQAIG